MCHDRPLHTETDAPMRLFRLFRQLLSSSRSAIHQLASRRPLPVVPMSAPHAVSIAGLLSGMSGPPNERSMSALTAVSVPTPGGQTGPDERPPGSPTATSGAALLLDTASPQHQLERTPLRSAVRRSAHLETSQVEAQEVDSALLCAYVRAQETARQRGRRHLVDDPFAQRFVAAAAGANASIPSRRLRRVLRALRLGVLTRTWLIDQLLLRVLFSGLAQRVLCLGAGYDMRPYRLALPPPCEWIEVDYLGVLEQKRGAISHTRPNCLVKRIPANLNDPHARKRIWSALFSSTPHAFPSPVHSTAGATRYRSGDPRARHQARPLRRSPRMSAHGNGRSPTPATVVLTEGVWATLDPTTQTALAGEVARLPGLVWWVMDIGSARTQATLHSTLSGAAHLPDPADPADLHGVRGGHPQDVSPELNDGHIGSAHADVPVSVRAQRAPGHAACSDRLNVQRSDNPGRVQSDQRTRRQQQYPRDPLEPLHAAGWKVTETHGIFSASCQLGLAPWPLRMLNHLIRLVGHQRADAIRRSWDRQAAIVLLNHQGGQE